MQLSRTIDRQLAALPWRRHPLAAIVTVVAVAIVAAAVLGPWTWMGVQALVERYPALRVSENLSLARVVQRLVMVFTLAGLVLTHRWSRFGDLFRDGYALVPGWARHVWAGAVFALATIGVMHGLLLLFGQTRFVGAAFDAGRLVERMLQGAMTGLTVGFVEEFFFRGVVYRALRSKIPLWPAIVASSLFYSALHFFNARAEWTAERVGPWSGFEAAGVLIGSFLSASELSRALGLTLLGMALAVAFERSGRLWLPFALHAVWVFVVRWDGLVVSGVYPRYYVWTGRSERINGLAAQIMLAAAIFALWYIGDRLARRTAQREGGTS